MSVINISNKPCQCRSTGYWADDTMVYPGYLLSIMFYIGYLLYNVIYWLPVV